MEYNLTKTGIGSFLLGLSGNVFIEVIPMTGWEIPQELARWLVFISLGFMVVGVLLILTSFKKSKGAQLLITQERFRVREEQWRELAKQKAPYFYQIPKTLQGMNDRLHVFAISELDDDLKDNINMGKLHLAVIELANMSVSQLTIIAKILNKIGVLKRGISLIILVFYVKSSMRIKGYDKKLFEFFLKIGWLMDEYSLGLKRKMENDSQYKELQETLKQQQVNTPISISDGIQTYANCSYGVNSFLRMYKYWASQNTFKLPAKIQAVLSGLEYMLDIVMKQQLSIFVSKIDNYVLGVKNER